MCSLYYSLRTGTEGIYPSESTPRRVCLAEVWAGAVAYCQGESIIRPNAGVCKMKYLCMKRYCARRQL